MTEAEWQTCSDPEKMLQLLSRRGGQRKRRLFGVACCRRVWHLIPDERSRSAVLVAEQFADGQADKTGLENARAAANEAYQQFSTESGPPYDSHYVTGACTCVASRNAGDAAKSWYGAVSAVQMRSMADVQEQTPALTSHPIMQDVWERERKGQTNLLRDIFGPLPIRPVTLDPAWATPTVKTLAAAIYTDRGFDRMPILADALEEAGCTSQDILNHCRQSSVHVRGCWALDLVLGKE